MRQISLLIGRQSYSMKTALSDDDIKDAQELVNEIMRDTGMTSEQEIRLAVACMVMANRLLEAGRRLDRIISQGEDAREEETGGNEPMLSGEDQ
ncbi:MAG: cyclin domain-containing protein [Synergistaceae bacterium]|nr:cyclin domain-containing protein [Synergistaceae bacterium]